ncbi:MAG: DUF1501 domain-containing protein [Saprospiraceae bacterium]|nr:DUF1501 domain-containing protein [Saprospiraceae bacterium]
MQNKHNSRRKFLGQLSCAAVGYTTMYNSVLSLKAINALAASFNPLDKDYRALVCINLSGGNDSFNMLIPTDTNEYNTYRNVRSNLALPRNELLPLQVRNTPGRSFGLHPAMTGLQDLFNRRKASFISNIGTLIDPLNADDFYNNNQIALPLGLFSHSDQSQHWQTGIPQTRTNIGWAGRMADLIKDMNTEDKISMNLSLSGTNILETGNEIIEYVIDPRQGSIGIRDYRPDNMYDQFNIAKTQAIDSLLAQQYHDAFEKTYMDVIRNSRDGHLKFKGALDQGPVINTRFSDNYLSESMKMIAKTVSVHEALGFKRQVFYVDFYGWDHHDEVLNNQNGMLEELSAAISEFYQATEELGLADQVTTFCISEFGRTLTSNGNGTDHAWGGNVFVVGADVNGGNIFGQYPDLALNSPLNIYEGTIIPTTPVDSYFAELALWMGVQPSDLNLVIPNIGNFFDVQSGKAPIGFLNL